MAVLIVGSYFTPPVSPSASRCRAWDRVSIMREAYPDYLKENVLEQVDWQHTCILTGSISTCTRLISELRHYGLCTSTHSTTHAQSRAD